MQNFRAPYIAILLAAVVCLGCSPGDSRPNVIVIMIDTLRADYLGAYGFEGDISPNIDAFARESTQFDRCFVQGPWTAPSVASFMTSLHPQNHCVGNGYGMFCEISEDDLVWSSLSEDAHTMAERFRDAGYATGGFVGNWVVKSKFGFAQGFDAYAEPEGHEQHVRDDQVVLDQAAQWLGERRKKQPFLLYLHLMDVHAPYRVDHQDIAAVNSSPSLGEDREITDEEDALRPVHLGLRINWSSEQAQRRLHNWRSAYAAGVRGFDRKLGRFLDLLREDGWLDNSVVVLTSDHGEEFLEHGAWEHGKTYYNEALRVPLLIRMPDTSGAGRKVDTVVSLIDVMPTLLELAGVESSEGGMQGSDLRPLLSATDAATGAATTDPLSFASALPQYTASIAVQNKALKLTLDLENGEHQLFDLVQDPGEMIDVSTERAIDAARMKRQVEFHLETLKTYPAFRPSSTPLSEEDIERLRSLGYVR